MRDAAASLIAMAQHVDYTAHRFNTSSRFDRTPKAVDDENEMYAALSATITKVTEKASLLSLLAPDEIGEKGQEIARATTRVALAGVKNEHDFRELSDELKDLVSDFLFDVREHVSVQSKRKSVA